MGNILELYCGFTTDRFKNSLETRPLSSENCIIFPWDSKLKDFSLEDFSPDIARGLLNYNELNELLDELSVIRNWDPNLDLMTCLALTLGSLFLLGVCVVPVISIFVTSLGFADVLVWLLMISGVFVTCFTFVCLCNSCMNEKGELRM